MYHKIPSECPLHSKRPPTRFPVSAVSAYVHSKHPLALSEEIVERPLVNEPMTAFTNAANLSDLHNPDLHVTKLQG